MRIVTQFQTYNIDSICPSNICQLYSYKGFEGIHRLMRWQALHEVNSIGIGMWEHLSAKECDHISYFLYMFSLIINRSMFTSSRNQWGLESIKPPLGWCGHFGINRMGDHVWGVYAKSLLGWAWNRCIWHGISIIK